MGLGHGGWWGPQILLPNKFPGDDGPGTTIYKHWTKETKETEKLKYVKIWVLHNPPEQRIPTQELLLNMLCRWQ